MEYKINCDVKKGDYVYCVSKLKNPSDNSVVLNIYRVTDVLYRIGEEKIQLIVFKEFDSYDCEYDYMSVEYKRAMYTLGEDCFKRKEELFDYILNKIENSEKVQDGN